MKEYKCIVSHSLKDIAPLYHSDLPDLAIILNVTNYKNYQASKCIQKSKSRPGCTMYFHPKYRYCHVREVSPALKYMYIGQIIKRIHDMYGVMIWSNSDTLTFDDIKSVNNIKLALSKRYK